MNTKLAVKSSMLATVCHTHTTTSPISEASLASQTTPKQSNSPEISKGTKVRHDSQNLCTVLLPAPYSVPTLIAQEFFLVSQARIEPD